MVWVTTPGSHLEGEQVCEAGSWEGLPGPGPRSMAVGWTDLDWESGLLLPCCVSGDSLLLREENWQHAHMLSGIWAFSEIITQHSA